MESEAIYPRRAMTNRSSDSASTASSVASSKPHVVQNYRSRIAILQLRARKRENENALLREQLDSQKAEKVSLLVRTCCAERLVLFLACSPGSDSGVRGDQNS